MKALFAVLRRSRSDKSEGTATMLVEKMRTTEGRHSTVLPPARPGTAKLPSINLMILCGAELPLAGLDPSPD